ncbi:MAG: hypothetical protein GY782_04505 [Gammaproteobacteria bacterium]|nr:hypothetical protein [Gammaproteobacteria bacterium]
MIAMTDMILSDSPKFHELIQQTVELGREVATEAIEHIGWKRETILDYQLQHLRKFLTHAKRNSPYYQDVLANIDTDNATLNTDFHRPFNRNNLAQPNSTQFMKQ